MTRRQRNVAVEMRADLILAEKHLFEAYAAHFEIQMRRGKVRGRLYACYLWVRRSLRSAGAGTILSGVP